MCFTRSAPTSRSGSGKPHAPAASADRSLLRQVEPPRRKRRRSLSQSSFPLKTFHAITPTISMAMTEMVKDAAVIESPSR